MTPVEVTKTGKPKVQNDVRSARELELTAAFARDRLAGLGREVLAGDITPAPWGPKDRGSCSWCSYQETCPFDETKKGCGYRFDSLKSSEAWAVIRGETEEESAPERAEGEEADRGIQ